MRYWIVLLVHTPLLHIQRIVFQALLDCCRLFQSQNLAFPHRALALPQVYHYLTTLQLPLLPYLTKHIIRIPCNITIKIPTSDEIVHLFFTKVVKYFRMPYIILSYREQHFMVKFWKSVWKCLGKNRIHSTAYYS